MTQSKQDTTIRRRYYGDNHILGALPFMLPYAMFASLVAAAGQGGWFIWIPFWAWVILGDQIFGLRTTNLDPATPERELWVYNLPLWVWALCQLGVTLYVFWQIHNSGHLSAGESIVLTVGLGLSALTLAAGHELIHRAAKWERLLGEVLLSSIAFAYYQTEHLFLHHRHVGTPLDPVFAAKGQSVWNHSPRGVVMSVLMSWRVETDRLARFGRPVWHWTNPFWRYNLLVAAWVALYAWMGGWFGVGLYFLQSLIAMTLLRVIDYVEHYGLPRQLLPSGRYERTEPRHSWNTSLRVSNWALWNGQRHSDHHRVASRHYALLQHIDEDAAPQLPYNYPVMLAIALIPPLWFKIVDPLTDAWRKQFYPDITPASWRAYDSRLYRLRPRQITLITEIMQTSARWSRWAERHPALLDSLEENVFTDLYLPDNLGLEQKALQVAQRGLVRVFYIQEFDASALKSILAESDSAVDLDNVLDEARSWVNARVFRAGMHMLRGSLEPRMSQAIFADLTDTSVEVVVDAVAKELTTKVGAMPGGQFAVVACNRLGRREVKAEDELELLYLYDYQPDAVGGENGSNSVTPGQYYDRLSTQCMKAFRSLARENLLFGSVTTPNGSFGSNGAAVSLTDFRERWRAGASLQDGLALAQARVIYGDAAIVQGFQQVKREVLAACRQRVQSTDEMASLRAGLTASPPAHPQAPLPRNIRGGLDDLDQAASCLKLMHGSECNGLLDLDTSAVFKQLAGEGVIDEETAKDLADASSLLRNIEIIRHMTVRDRGHDTELTEAMEKAICLACEQESMSSLAKRAQETADRAAERIDSLVTAS